MPTTKTPQLLTVPKATAQARRIVDKLMPGAMATVESKLSHDLATDTPTVVTTVTFPFAHENAENLAVELNGLTGVRAIQDGATYIRFTRTR
jgi:hypothetical protein